jgi:hypothetical protein
MGWPEMVDDERLAEEYRARVERLIGYLATNPPPFGVLADTLTADYNSLASGRLKRAIESGRLTLASIDRLRDGAEAIPGAEHCSVRYGSREFEMPSAVLPALQYLELHRPCAVADLPESIDDDSKLVLVRRLMAEGIVDAVS